MNKTKTKNDTTIDYQTIHNFLLKIGDLHILLREKEKQRLRYILEQQEMYEKFKLQKSKKNSSD